MIKAVIFDMDGVISDTLPIHIESERRVLFKYGINISADKIIKEFNAVPDKEMFERIFKENNKHLNFQEVKDEKWQIFRELAGDKIEVIPGSLELINNLLKYGFILGLASSSPSRVIDLVTEVLGIKQKFKVIIGTEEVKHGKPSPDIFLIAAKRMKMDPEFCLVIEDAPRGIQAAKAAGMKCIAITTTHPKEELIEADVIIDSFDEINIKELKNL